MSTWRPELVSVISSSWCATDGLTVDQLKAIVRFSMGLIVSTSVLQQLTSDESKLFTAGETLIIASIM
jgi:hypothetical protein